MSCGPITPACRSFLARHCLYPGHVSRALIKAKLRGDWGARRRLRLQGHYWSQIKKGSQCDEAFLEYHPKSGNTLLKVKRKKFWYREHGNGVADLIIFNTQLPEVVCSGLDPDLYRLSEIIAHPTKPFYLAADPLVRRIRNAVRDGRQALVVTLVPVWTDANWRYSDGRDRWDSY